MEGKMKNKILWLVIILVSEMTIVGCTDKSLINGRWVANGGEMEFNFNNGNFEHYIDKDLIHLGTYIIIGSKITMKVSHIYGPYLEDLESKMYTKEDYEIELKKMDRTDESIAYHIKMFPSLGDFSYKNDMLTHRFNRGRTIYLRDRIN